MTALTNADRARKAEAAADNLRSQMKGYLDDNAKARQEAENARREADAPAPGAGSAKRPDQTLSHDHSPVRPEVLAPAGSPRP